MGSGGTRARMWQLVSYQALHAKCLELNSGKRLCFSTRTCGQLCFAGDTRTLVPVDRSRKRECPRCAGVKLHRHFFSAKRRVEVDQCPNCAGYWLDAGELAMIRAETSQAAVAEQARHSSISADVIRYLYRLRTEQRRP